MARAEGLPSRSTSRFFIMTEKENEIANFILGLFSSTSIPQDEVYQALNEKYGFTYDPDPRIVVEILKNHGIIRTLGETYFMLTEYGENYLENKKRKCKPQHQIFEITRKMLYYTMHNPKEEARKRAEKKRKNKRANCLCLRGYRCYYCDINVSTNVHIASTKIAMTKR